MWCCDGAVERSVYAVAVIVVLGVAVVAVAGCGCVWLVMANGWHLQE